METEESKKAFLMPVQVSKGGQRYDIFFTEEQSYRMPLSKLKEKCIEMKLERIYNYFLALLELVASLCYQRNYFSIIAFEPHFPAAMCFNCAQDPNLPFEMRAKFTKLILYLHLDKNDTLEFMSIPVLSRPWNSIQSGNSVFPRAFDIPIDMDKRLKPFVEGYIRDCNGIMRSFEKDKNELTYAVLMLSESMIKYGFYQTQEELIDLVDPMITLLDGSKDLTSKQEEEQKSAMSHSHHRNMDRYEKNEQNMSVMKCKTKMCSIMFLVMDIQNDIRISRILVSYKERFSS